jgi:hypothetical protein
VIEHLIFLTGRDEGEGRAVALKWLETKARFPVDSERVHLFMKAAGDRRADTITKLETFEKYIRPFYRVLFVLEDRSRVVDMWRQKGLACFQVAEKDD